MAQISSAYPTAGGLYHWGSILGNRFTGWVTAWLNLLGLVTVLGAINVGTWTSSSAPSAPAVRHRRTRIDHRRRSSSSIITGAQALINHIGIGLTAKLTDFSGYLIFGGSIVIAVVCLARRRHLGLRPALHLHQLFRRRRRQRLAGGLERPGCSLLGLLLPIYTITGYDASAHTSEETIKAAHLRAARHGDVGALVGALRLHLPVRLRADDPEHGRCGQAGLERVLLGDRRAGQPGGQGDRLPRDLRLRSACAASRP